jgi:hypothetical protein
VDFPGVETGRHRGFDIFIYSPDQQSTIIAGGSGDDIVTCARFLSGPSPAVLIGGYTNSPDFPIAASGVFGIQMQAPQAKFGGGAADGFLMYFYPAASGNLDFSTYLGGSGDDYIWSVDSPGTYYGVFAAAGSTTSTDFPLANAWQTSPGGGTDGFATILNNQGQITFSTYLGGTGEDRALAVAVGVPSTSSPSPAIYFAGESGSTDWQPPGSITGSRSGVSDGFLLRVDADSAQYFQMTQGLYFGGSGKDSITALAVLPNGNIAAAGNTSSPDLASAGVTGQYGGGASDAFVVQFSGDLLHPIWGSYLGGSGDDTASALSANARNETLIGGVTSSADFLASAASASPCGQGVDGFWAHFDAIGRRIASSCVGGSGTDRINSVAFDQDVHIFLGGSSDSLDLALKNSPQAANAGLSDGFYLSVAETVIHGADVTIGKDLAATETVLLGDPKNTLGTPLTATSSDPSRVLFGLRPDDPGQASVTVAYGSASAPDQRSFLVSCLVSSGDIPITLSAPGYPDLAVTVHCVPSGLFFSGKCLGRHWVANRRHDHACCPRSCHPTGHRHANSSWRFGPDPHRRNEPQSRPY